MAGVMKFTHGAVENQLKHCNRTLDNDSNTDIDPSRTHLNVSLTETVCSGRKLPEYDYYLQRKGELYCYNRADVKTMAGWIVTAPQELETREEILSFFKHTANFLTDRYGKENTISITCHFDEGKIGIVKDRWGNVVTDDSGTPLTQLVLGRPHLHFNFIPVAPDKKHVQKEKICANDVLNPHELQHFHTDLRKYLKDHNCAGAEGVINGKTKAQGRNYTVAEMKERYELEKELFRLREIERKYELERTKDIERGRWK